MSAAGAQLASLLEEVIESAAARTAALVLDHREQALPERSPWYSGDEAADYCRMTREALDQARKRGQLNCHKSETGRIRYHINDLEAFLRAKDAA